MGSFAVACLMVMSSALRADHAMAEDTEAGEEHLERHRTSIFLGGTFEAHESGATVGLSYEYRFSDFYGAGAFVDRAWGDFDATIYGAAGFIHPLEPITLLIGIGVEREGGENSFAVRVGGGYEFPLGERYWIAPSAYLDFVEGEGASSGVIGLEFGAKF
jgi:hypothetical protein